MRKLLSFIVITLFVCVNTYAHPHVFVQTKVSVVLNNVGIEQLKIEYIFDKIFSEELKKMFDTDKNGSFNSQEIAQVKAKAFSNLVKSEYFVHVFNGNKKVAYSKISGFTAKIENGQVEYFFTMNIKVPIGKSNQTIKIAPYDSSYYIDVSLDYNTNNVKILNGDAYEYSYSIKEESQLAYYFDQVYPECVYLIIKKK